MKKIIILGIVSIFLFTSFNGIINAGEQSSNDKIITAYSFGSPVVSKVNINNTMYDSISIDGASCDGNPGEPCLPVRGSYILLPPNSKVNNIVVNPGQKVSLGSGYLIEPAEKPVPLSDTVNAQVPVPNKEIYSSTNVFPGKLYTEVGTYRCRGYDILVLMLHPVQYIPASGELFYYPNLTVNVETVKETEDNSLFRGLQEDNNDVIGKVDNPSMANTYMEELHSKPVPPLKYDLLIITSNSLKSGFEPLKQAHDTGRIKTLIYTVEDIYSHYQGVDDADKIRNYVKYAYETYGIDYVLLGGDVGIVPARRLYDITYDAFGPIITPVSNNIPADLYYGCLDGSFNSNGNDKWGEPNDGDNGGDVDLMAEVYVGRACVDNMEDVGNFVNKTIKYMVTTSTDKYLENVTMAGEYLGFFGVANYGDNYLDELIDGCKTHGYTTVGIPSAEYTIDKLYDSNWEKISWHNPIFDPDKGWPKSEIMDRINNSVHIINHWGHSNYDYNMKMYISDVDALANDDLFFVYSQGCMAGGFDNFWGDDDCIAEHFTVKTPHAAFAGIWNAREGWGQYFSTDGSSQRFDREFWDAVFGENIKVISKANQDSKEDNLYRINNKQMRWCYYELNLFGDPAVSLKIENIQPGIPDRPSGPQLVKIGEECNYVTSSIDLDGNQIKYGWDWNGDQKVDEWTDYYPSDTSVTTSHSWSLPGPRLIRVKAMDDHGLQSMWSDPLPIWISILNNNQESQSSSQSNLQSNPSSQNQQNSPSVQQNTQLFQIITKTTNR